MGLVHQIHTLQRMIQRHGVDFKVLRDGKNEFGEPSGEREICSLRGLFHASNGFLAITFADKGQVSTEKKPRLLILHYKDLQKNDLIVLEDGSSYRITGLDDLGNLHLCLDLSLGE